MKLSFKKHVSLIVAEFVYCGRFPFMPGTAGSLGSFIIWAPMIYVGASLWSMIAVLIALFFLGVWASEYAIVYYGKPDPKQVVIDEVVGQGIALLLASFSLVDFLAAFALFRLFDILKPWPINALERRLKDKWGLMLDDVLAGIFALIVFAIGNYVRSAWL